MPVNLCRQLVRVLQVHRNMSENSIKNEVKLKTDRLKEKSKKRKGKNLDRNRGDQLPVQKKPRPNYFIAIPIQKPNILGRILAVQNLIISDDERLTKAAIPTSTIHITLAVLHLDEKDVSKATEILKAHQSQVLDIVGANGINLQLKGLGEFRKEVLFVNIAPSEGLKQLTALSDAHTLAEFRNPSVPLLTDELNSCVIELTHLNTKHFYPAFVELLVNCCGEFIDSNEKAFKPHVTIMKLSKLRGRRQQKVKKIHPCLYDEYKDMNFGSEKANSVQLLSMMKKKQANGFYHSEYALNLKTGSDRDLIGQCDWDMHEWAERIATSCMTTALHFSNANCVSRFSSYVSSQILRDALKNLQRDETLKNAKNTDGVCTRLEKLKKNLKQRFDDGQTET